MRPPRALPAPLLLAALVLLAWGGALRVPFHYDDFPGIVRDEATWDAGALAGRLPHGIRPLLRASYFADHALWGMDPRGFHATNLALHVATALGVLALARRRLRDGAAAFAAAAVFALQPADAEVVAYVSGRSTGLMAALLVAALLAHERARDREGRARRAWQVASWALFALACLAKEVALIYPALLWLWEASRRQEARAAGAADGSLHPGPGGSVPWGLLVLAAGVLGLLALSPRYRALAGFSLGLRGPVDSLRVNLRAVPVMLSLWLRPWALSIDHGFDPSAPAPLDTLAGAALVCGSGALALAARRRAPRVTLAVGWALLALAPTNSLISKLDPVTEKPLYLAWIGPALLLGAAAGALLRRARGSGRTLARAVAGVGMGLVLAAGGGAVARRVALWQDPRALWADAVARAPDNARAWNNLGMACLAAHEDGRARRAFLRALRLDPGDGAASRNLALLETLCEGGCADPGPEDAP